MHCWRVGLVTKKKRSIAGLVANLKSANFVVFSPQSQKRNVLGVLVRKSQSHTFLGLIWKLQKNVVYKSQIRKLRVGYANCNPQFATFSETPLISEICGCAICRTFSYWRITFGLSAEEIKSSPSGPKSSMCCTKRSNERRLEERLFFFHLHY